MTCPHLEYRSEAAGQSFEVARAYCAVAERFVEPMRADVCNDRFAFEHAQHCEIFLAHASSDADGGDETQS